METTASGLRKWGPLLVRAFADAELPGVWGLAIARQESNFDPGAKSLGGGDGTRGGSYGLCQMSLLTARHYRPDIEPRDLLDPTINAHLAAEHCRELCIRYNGALKDVAAAYNSGKSFEHAPESTRTVYVPHVLQYAELYRDEADAMEKSG